MLRKSRNVGAKITYQRLRRTRLKIVGLGAGLCAGAAITGVTTGVIAADTLEQPRATALEDAAAHYILYREDVAAIEATPFDKPSTTREAHKRLAAHDPKALTAGWVAYAALVAADTPEFAASLQNEIGGKKKKKRRRKKGDLRGRDAFYAKLAQDPSYPRKLEGAEAAINRVLTMTVQDASRFSQLGAAFKDQAYAMQKTKWGKKRIATSAKRIGEASDYASSRPAASAPTLSRATNNGVTAPMLASANETWDYNWGADGVSGRMSSENAQVIMDRVLNLAARYAVGDVNEKQVSVYAKNNKSESCLSFAKLTLTQCIAATRTPYEEAFCLGEHGLNDIGTCVGWVAGAGAS